jgi:hypothetical protein
MRESFICQSLTKLPEQSVHRMKELMEGIPGDLRSIQDMFYLDVLDGTAPGQIMRR